MRYLVDANVLLWMIYHTHRLTKRVHAILADPQTILLISQATLCELLAKAAKGHLLAPGITLPQMLARFDALRPTYLPITRDLILRSVQLPRHHGDPFDRILVAHALAESVPILSSDGLLSRYGATVIWE